jgi:molybdopterin-guanine dinucleotide biosynthesis protein A
MAPAPADKAPFETDSGDISEISAVVLSGGRSSRLGQEKAFLQVNGQHLIERIVDKLACLSDEVIVVANDLGKYEHLEALVVGDVYPGCAALGGIYSGLRAASRSRSLVVACDMPFLNLSLLRYMQAQAADHDVVIPRIGEYEEALHAIYSRSCLPLIERQILAGDLRISTFFHDVRVRYVGQSEIDTFDPDHLSFFNINSQADLDEARAIWSRELSGDNRAPPRSGPVFAGPGLGPITGPTIR